MKPVAKPSTSLNDLLGQNLGAGSSGVGLATGQSSRRAGNFDDLFGAKPQTPSFATPAIPVVAPPQQMLAASTDNFDAGRILRLETELERINRELEDTKRRKREDEEDLESFWKSKLEVQSKENSKTVEELKTNHKAQISKLQEEHFLEVNRLKENFNRQLDDITSSANQVGDIVAVVGKVDVLSHSIDKIAADVALVDDVAALKLEQMKVHDLNLSLKDLIRNQQNDNEKVCYLKGELI
uniref:Nsp1_C domain-containing protein n=1 Tax=Caenorhabditis tropicalis TaxID=1561998 RepID=A0A1I7V344_9PELO